MMRLENFLKCDGCNWMRSDLSLGGFRVRGMTNPKTDQDGVNLRTLQDSEMRVLEQASAAFDMKILEENEGINKFESQKYLLLNVHNQMAANRRKNGNKIVGLADAEEQTDGVNKITLDLKIWE